MEVCGLMLDSEDKKVIVIAGIMAVLPLFFMVGIRMIPEWLGWTEEQPYERTALTGDYTKYYLTEDNVTCFVYSKTGSVSCLEGRQ